MGERHESIARGAEERSRLEGWEPQERVAARVAPQLRCLADRLDGRHQPRVWIHPG